MQREGGVMGASFGGAKKFLGVAAAAMLAVALGAANSSAGDVTASPADGLDITNSSTKLLPDGQASESSWLSGFHMSGYATQTFGMWQDPSSTHAWTRSSNQLAVSRTLLQVDENYRLNENNTFFAREWFVYEPPTPSTVRSTRFDSAVQNAYLTPFCGKTGRPRAMPVRLIAKWRRASATSKTILQQLFSARRLVGEQDRPADDFRRQPDRGVGPVAGVPHRRRHQSAGFCLGLWFRQPRAIAQRAVDDPSDSEPAGVGSSAVEFPRSGGPVGLPAAMVGKQLRRRPLRSARRRRQGWP